jgi:hypothetical protein
MIKNFLTSGCSFTHGAGHDWPSVIAEKYNPAWHRNLAMPGAGNYYIAESIIQCLNNERFNPEETLVIIMWSGYYRLDLQVTEEFFNMLDHYPYKKKIYKNNYVFSGGQMGGWQNDLLLNNLFKSSYAVINHEILANETLNHMLRTRLFLEHHGYNYKFLSFFNFWQDGHELVTRQDYSLKKFNNLLYDQVLKANWIFNDDKKNCFYEFVKERGLFLGDNFHPNNQGHKEFAYEYIMPHIKKYFND